MDSLSTQPTEIVMAPGKFSKKLNDQVNGVEKKKEDEEEKKEETESGPPTIQQELQSEVDLTHMTRLLETMQKDDMSEELLEECPELANVVEKNNKLQYRKAFLERAIGVSKKPSEVAAEIVSKLPKCELIAKTETAPAGFINVFVNEEFIARQCEYLAREGIKLPRVVSKRVIVDFSSPNIAKEMHVGHLRSTIIGDAISRLFEAVGFDVLRLNHIGDWGTQFGMLIAHLIDTFPNFQSDPPAIGELQGFYKESKKRFDEDAQFKERAYDCVVKLQKKDPEFIKAWTIICNVSRSSNNELYRRIDIKLTERGESFYQERMMGVIEHLKEQEVLREVDGGQLMFLNGCKIDADENELLPLNHPKEIKLAKQVLKLSDVILTVLDSLMLHTVSHLIFSSKCCATTSITSLLYSLNSTLFYVVEKIDGTSKVNMNRLVLCDVTANAMEKALHILGITPVPKM